MGNSDYLLDFSLQIPCLVPFYLKSYCEISDYIHPLIISTFLDCNDSNIKVKIKIINNFTSIPPFLIP